MKKEFGYTRIMYLLMILGIAFVIFAECSPELAYHYVDKFTSGKSTSTTYSTE